MVLPASFLAGIRFLALDLHYGVKIDQARLSSKLVLAAGIILALLIWHCNMVKRVVTGAHYGLRDWLAQRVTAVVMVVFILCLTGVLLVSPPHDYAGWKALFSNRWMRIASLSYFCQPVLACLDRYAQYPDGLCSCYWHPPDTADTGHTVLGILYHLVRRNSMGS